MVRGPTGRFEMGRGDPSGGPGRVRGPSGRFETGLGTIR